MNMPVLILALAVAQANPQNEATPTFTDPAEGPTAKRKAPEPLISAGVTAAVGGDPRRGGIPLAVTIHNGLKGSIRHTTFALKPNAWTGETLNLTLVDVYWEGEWPGCSAPRRGSVRRLSCPAHRRRSSGPGVD